MRSSFLLAGLLSLAFNAKAETLFCDLSVPEPKVSSRDFITKDSDHCEAKDGQCSINLNLELEFHERIRASATLSKGVISLKIAPYKANEISATGFRHDSILYYGEEQDPNRLTLSCHTGMDKKLDLNTARAKF